MRDDHCVKEMQSPLSLSVAVWYKKVNMRISSSRRHEYVAGIILSIYKFEVRLAVQLWLFSVKVPPVIRHYNYISLK